MLIQFHFTYPVTLKNRKRLKLFLNEMFVKEKTLASSLNIIFCSDNYLLSINRSFLAHDYYTDIISFNLNNSIIPVEGEVYISVDRIKENASEYKNSRAFELHRVIFHGVLHFCGYNDKTNVEKRKMRAKEDFYLNSYFVPRETNR